MHNPSEIARNLKRMANVERLKAVLARRELRNSEADRFEAMADAYEIAAHSTLVDAGIITPKNQLQHDTGNTVHLCLLD